VPTYEYKCSSCEHQYETREGFDAPSRQPCPRCGAVARRLLFPPPVVFKGSGFYVTDSRKGSTATIGDMPGPATGAEAKSDGAASTESKPAAAAASSED
jgi:putative FmdB family regulatory protein